jgi:hypothetical protein
MGDFGETASHMIAVIGSSEEDAVLNGFAEEAGRLIAESGATLVNGGKGGVMAASAKGARSAGGRVVGLLPGIDNKEANEFTDIVIPTGLGEGRNLLIVRAASVVIAIGGGYGTLSEVAFALKLGRPVVGLGTWEVSEEITEVVSASEAVKKAVEFLSTQVNA